MRKAQSDPMKFIIGAIILIVAAVIIMMIYYGFFNSANRSGKDLINASSPSSSHFDCDHDGIPDIVDPCICPDQATCASGNAQAIEKCKEQTIKNCNNQ